MRTLQYLALVLLAASMTYVVGTNFYEYSQNTVGTAVTAPVSRTEPAGEVPEIRTIIERSVARRTDVPRSKLPGSISQRVNFSMAGLTKRQLDVLRLARVIAIEEGISPEDFQGIVFQETKAGGLKQYRVAGHEFGLNTMQRYYGLTQIKIAAARDVLKRYPDMHRYAQSGRFTTDEELVAHLILNDEFNLRMGSKYLRLICSEQGKDLGRSRCITAYNRGVAGSYRVDPEQHYYTRAVFKHVEQTIKPFNARLDGESQT
jgi:hypothetical protein